MVYEGPNTLGNTRKVVQTMNKDQVKGRVKEFVGKVKQTAGRNAGDVDQHDEGVGQELKGKIQKTFGDVKHNVAREIDK